MGASVLIAVYSYFDYDQMTLLGIGVHSGELELLQQTADSIASLDDFY